MLRSCARAPFGTWALGMLLVIIGDMVCSSGRTGRPAPSLRGGAVHFLSGRWRRRTARTAPGPDVGRTCAKAGSAREPAFGLLQVEGVLPVPTTGRSQQS